MARPRLTVPAYRKHVSGKACVSVYRSDGSRTEILLPGKHGSKQSKEEYERLLCQLRSNEDKLPVASRQDITISELVLRFMQHAETYYVNPATNQPTNEVIPELLRPPPAHPAGGSFFALGPALPDVEAV